MSGEYTLELHRRVYDDKSGGYVEVRPDVDGLGLVMLSQVSEAGVRVASITLVPAQARLVSDALHAAADEAGG